MLLVIASVKSGCRPRFAVPAADARCSRAAFFECWIGGFIQSTAKRRELCHRVGPALERRGRPCNFRRAAFAAAPSLRRPAAGSGGGAGPARSDVAAGVRNRGGLGRHAASRRSRWFGSLCGGGGRQQCQFGFLEHYFRSRRACGFGFDRDRPTRRIRTRSSLHDAAGGRGAPVEPPVGPFMSLSVGPHVRAENRGGGAGGRAADDDAGGQSGREPEASRKPVGAHGRGDGNTAVGRLVVPGSAQ